MLMEDLIGMELIGRGGGSGGVGVYFRTYCMLLYQF